MTSISKIAYVDKLDDIVNKYKIGIIAQLKWSLLVKNQKYIDSNKEINNKDLEIGEVGRISKYKNIFGKGYTPNCSEEVFGIKKS